MKKYIIVLTILLGVLVGGCSKKIENSVIFDNYNIKLETKNNYQEIAANTIQGVPIIKQYIQTSETGFLGSIIIAQTTLQTGIDIESFAAINSKSITRKISGTTDTSTDSFDFDCLSGSIKAVIEETTIKEGTETKYLNQIFFAKIDKLYGISTITTDKKESKNLSKSIKQITCIGEKNILPLNNQ